MHVIKLNFNVENSIQVLLQYKAELETGLNFRKNWIFIYWTLMDIRSYASFKCKTVLILVFTSCVYHI